jgi:hypothetical protein
MTSPVSKPTGVSAAIQRWRERRKARILKHAADKITLKKDLGDAAYRRPGDDITPGG